MTTYSRGSRLFVIAIALLGSVIFPFTPSAADQKTVATFKGQSNLVLIPTVVHDKAGAHVGGLTKDDFMITADGEKRAISVFEEVKPGNAVIQRAATKPGEFTNMVNGQLRPNRLTIIALDATTTPALRQQKARVALLKVLADTIRQDSMVGMVLITSSGTHLVQDFTTDPQVLIEALNKVISSQPIAQDSRTTTEETPLWDFEKKPPPGVPSRQGSGTGGLKDSETQQLLYYLGIVERNAQDLERRFAIEHELAALEQIGQGLRGIPGRKSLIWVGAGFPFSVNGAAMGLFIPDAVSTATSSHPLRSPVTPPDPTAQLRMMLPQYQRAWRILNDANVAVYGIDVRGITATGDAASVRYPSPNEQARQRWMNWDTQDTFRIFADVTGGRAYTNTNDLERAYRESLNDGAAYYLLGYYVDRKKDKVGWHELNVKVDRPNVEVRSRKGFFLRTTDDKQTQNQELDVALHSPLDYTGLPIMGRWVADEGKSAKRKVTFALLIPAGSGLIDESAGNHIDVEIYVRVLSPDGKTVAHTGQEMEGKLPTDIAEKAKREGIRYEGDVELAPGNYTAYVVVRDKLSDRIGSVSTSMTVPTNPTVQAE